MTTKEYKTVLVEKEDGITWVILNRPEKRNAMSPQLHFDMYDAVTECEGDPETQVMIITGAGSSWCAGQDLKEYFREGDKNQALRRQASLVQPGVALAEALHLPQAHHRHGERLLLRRRLHSAGGL